MPAACSSAAALGCVHERCYTTLVFRSNQSVSASPVQDAMLQLWLRRMRRFTALPIVIMHANVPSPRRLMNATAHQPVESAVLVAHLSPWPLRPALQLRATPTQTLRIQLHRVGLLIVDPPGTLPWYREQYTKLHAWSLPCRQVARLGHGTLSMHVHMRMHIGPHARDRSRTSTTTASRCVTWMRSSTSAAARHSAPSRTR